MARATTNGDAEEKVLRISVTVDPSVRRLIRIAAAVNDMEPGEWAASILEKAATKALEGEVK